MTPDTSLAAQATLTGLDWLMIGALLRRSAVRGVVGGPQGQGLRRPTISWPAAIWAGGSSAHRSSPRTSDPSTSSDSPARAPPAAWRWRTTSCTRGVCWCWRGCSCRSTCARWCSRCRSSWRRRFIDQSRYVLSIVSLITFIDLEDRGGHLRRRRGVRDAAAGDADHNRQIHIDSFWIGSVLVIVLTGLYTTLGGMRAVAYNDAVQVVRPDPRLGAADRLRADSAGRLGASCARSAARRCSISGSR